MLVGRGGAVGEAGERCASRAQRARGARVEVMRADVSRGATTSSRVLAEVRPTMPPLRGVIHAAMVLDDAPLAELDRERLERVLAPKMAGAWHLHPRDARRRRSTAFVLFSSFAAIVRQPACRRTTCAANAFLDALAHHRRALGLPALSISWGMLSEVGLLSRHRDVADYLERQGYLPFTPAQALRGSSRAAAATTSAT